MTTNVKSAETTPISLLASGTDCDLVDLCRQIRICRSVLGAVLDELELGDRTGQTTHEIAACITSITGEVESLWDIAKPVK